jgi:hypothetical protein
VHRLHDLLDCANKPFKLSIIDHEGRRNLQHHEIIAADLREYSMVPEHLHGQDLAEYCRMDFCN